MKLRLSLKKSCGQMKHLRSYLFFSLFLIPFYVDAKEATTNVKSEVVKTYARLVYLNYVDAYQQAIQLNWAIDDFLANPNEASFDKAKSVWLESRKSYGTSEAFRFYEGPIDYFDTQTQTEGPEARINSWPLNEAYIDYVAGQEKSGLINDLTFQINTVSLDEKNQKSDEADVSTGYHSIEFLLWGQDLSLDLPGQRTISDYQPGSQINARRRSYLRIVTGQLVDDLSFLVDSWQPNQTENYASQFLQLDPDLALEKILTGIATLSGFELAAERMAVPLDSGDQEDEHSCFSDNTHNDFIYNLEGIENVYFGRYADFQGVGLKELIENANPDLNSEFLQILDQSKKEIDDIPAPIDREVLSTPINSMGRKKMEVAIVSLQRQSELLKQIGQALSLKVSIQTE